MKEIFKAGLLVLIALMLSVPTYASDSFVLAHTFSILGEAADANQIVTSVDMSDTQTLTILAQPDICRDIDMTIVDANESITAGIYTIVGTDCYGDALTATFDFDGESAGVNIFTPDVPWLSVTSIISGLLTGEAAGDTITVGYTDAPQKLWFTAGDPRFTKTIEGDIIIDPTRWWEFPSGSFWEVNTSGVSSVTLVGVDTDNDAFRFVDTGDFLRGVYGRADDAADVSRASEGATWFREVATNADADTVTVDLAITLGTVDEDDGVGYQFQRPYTLSDDANDNHGWFPVGQYADIAVVYQFYTISTTGNLVTHVECKNTRYDDEPIVVEVGTTDVSAVGTATHTVDLTRVSYEFCRAGAVHDTGSTGANSTSITVFTNRRGDRR